MLRRWSRTHSWLVVWELLALFWFAVAANRFQRADTIVSTDTGVTPMAWGILMDFIVAASFSAVCAFVGLIPAAWKSLGPSHGSTGRPGSGPLDPTSEQAGQSLSA